MTPTRERSIDRRKAATRAILTVAGIIFAASALQSCGFLNKTGGSSAAAFGSGKEFLAHITAGKDPEKKRLFQAFGKAGVPMPAALTDTLAGKVALETGENAAREAVKNSAGGVNETFHAAGVPKNIPLVRKTERNFSSKQSQLALNDTALNEEALDKEDVDVNNPGGGGGNNPAQCQARVSCFASASATAAAFACAFAEAWACVYSSVPPFGQLCTWARSSVCTAAFVSVYSEVYVEAFVNVCQGCQGGQGGGANDNGDDGALKPTVTPAPIP